MNGLSQGKAVRVFLPPLLVILVALAAYANAWPNALVHDDKFCRGSERFTALSNIPRYFTERAWATSGGSSNLYRPLLLTSITVDARVHGEWFAGYHLSNIGMHALVSLLVFVFVRQSLVRLQGASRVDIPVAVAGALVFAVHPVHTEVVNSIFNRSEMLAALAALAGLTWFLRHLDAKPVRAWAGLGFAYLAAMLCRESAIMLPGIAVTLVLAITPGSFVDRVRKCVPAVSLLLPLILYGVLRVAALAPDTVDEAPAHAPGAVADAPAQAPGVVADAAVHAREKVADLAELLESDARAIGLDFPDGRRFFRIFGFWYESLRVLALPHPLSVAPISISGSDAIAGLVLTVLLLALAVYRASRGYYGLLVGLAIFCIASLPASRLIGESWMAFQLSERYLYLPSIGLAVATAFALRYLALRTSIRAVAGATLAVLILFMPLTWARNSDWASDITLYESDYRNGAGRRSGILVWLTAAYLVESSYDKAAEICDRHVAEQQRLNTLSSQCGIAYGRLGRFRDAEEAHVRATSGRRTDSLAHANFAYFHLTQGRWRDAKAQFEESVRKEWKPAARAVKRGTMLVQLYTGDREKLLEAKAQFEKALELQPSLKQAEEWLARVNQMLDSLPVEEPHSKQGG